MTKTIFTPDQFENLIKMGSSPDVENQVLALSLIQTVDFKKHMVYIMLLKKLGNIQTTVWMDHAPDIHKALGEVLDLTQTITYKKIFNALGKNKVGEEQMLFFLDYFGKYLLEQCNALGYDFVKDVHLNLNTLEIDAEQSRNASQGS